MNKEKLLKKYESFYDVFIRLFYVFPCVIILTGLIIFDRYQKTVGIIIMIVGLCSFFIFFGTIMAVTIRTVKKYNVLVKGIFLKEYTEIKGEISFNSMHKEKVSFEENGLKINEQLINYKDAKVEYGTFGKKIGFIFFLENVAFIQTPNKNVYVKLNGDVKELIRTHSIYESNKAKLDQFVNNYEIEEEKIKRIASLKTKKEVYISLNKI